MKLKRILLASVIGAFALSVLAQQPSGRPVDAPPAGKDQKKVDGKDADKDADGKKDGDDKKDKKRDRRKHHDHKKE